MNAQRLVTTAIVCLAMASLSFSAEPKSWAAPLAGKVARIQLASKESVEGNDREPWKIVPFMSLDRTLAKALTAEMAQCKIIKHGRLMLGSGPFVILRSSTNRILGVCELPLDGGFIPYDFSANRGMIILGHSVTKRRTRYGVLPYLVVCWPLHSIWKEDAVARYGPPTIPGREAKAPAKTGPPWR